MPIGAPPRHIPTRNVGLKPLRTTCRPSSIESRNSESAEMKILSEGLTDIVALRTQGITYAHRRSYDSHKSSVRSRFARPGGTPLRNRRAGARLRTPKTGPSVTQIACGVADIGILLGMIP